MKKEKKNSPTWQQNLKSYFSQYCSSTSIHGVQYVGERGRYAIEKIIWFVIITVIWYFCITLIVAAYQKWVTSPVIVTFATTETPISKIPFPAVTICPEVKTMPEVLNFTDILVKLAKHEKIDNNDIESFNNLCLICKAPALGDLLEQLQLAYTVNESSVHNLQEMSLLSTILGSVDEEKWSLNWLKRNVSWLQYTSALFTSEGYCHTFNMIDPKELLDKQGGYIASLSLNGKKPHSWSYDGGYTDGNEADIFPRRTFLSGPDGGVEFKLYTNHSHLDYLCGVSLQGFQVVLHNPSELPNMDQYFRLPLDQAVNVGIKPRMITVGEELKNYKPQDRKCYYSNERKLMYFEGYTQNNCLSECLSNYTLSKCHCLAFYMPKHDDSPICGPRSYSCLEKHKVDFLLFKPSGARGTDCDCLPSCNSLEYDTEISQSNWDWRKIFEVTKAAGVEQSFVDLDYTKDHFSILTIYFKEMQFLTSERHELHGYVDFFSNIGGLLGLFIGFSVTSVIEILYFLTLRLGCNIRKYGRRLWSGDPELINAENDQQNDIR